MPSLQSAAPQFLVDKLSDALAFYQERLGFTLDFVYDDFYVEDPDGSILCFAEGTTA